LKSATCLILKLLFVGTLFCYSVFKDRPVSLPAHPQALSPGHPDFILNHPLPVNIFFLLFFLSLLAVGPGQEAAI